MAYEEGQKVLDTRALEIAVESRAMIMSHLKECEQKHNDVISRLDATAKDRENLSTKVDSKFDGVYQTIDAKFILIQSTINRAAYGTLGLTILALGYFLIRFGLPGQGVHP